MQPPLKLKAFDQVALVCPGSICRQLDHPQITKDYLSKHYQLQSVFDNDTTQSLPPSQRAEILLKYLFDPNIKLITQLRGGEGTADILPYIHQHYEKIKVLPPKILLGFSDFTALLVYFSKHYHWPVIHGSSPLKFALNLSDDKTQKLTMDLLFGHQTLIMKNLTPLNDFAREDKVIEAELTGGNLSVAQISIKDLWEIDTSHKIVFFEDCAEKAHKIIRALKYFSRIGLFDTVKAVIFGDFTSTPIGCQQVEQESNQRAILKTLSSFAAHHQFPVLYTPQFGHGISNFPLLYSIPYRLNLGSKELELTGYT